MGEGRTSSNDRRVALLGKGGFGEVELIVRAEGRFERLFAKKRLLPAHHEDVELRSMFFEEARLAGMIRHPNVVSVLDVGEDEQGPYLLMDYVEGVSAHRLIEATRARKEELPLQVCLRVVMQVAEGLHAAHELTDREGHSLGLVHRDVSPANVLVGYDGMARVTDFGVARALGRTTKTSTGFLKGKFGYMSPEQLRFEEPDRRSDIFALGVVLFELICARRLYANNEGMDGARRILNEPPPDLADFRDDVPEALVQLLFKMLAKDREHRPATAREVAARLEEIIAQLALEEGRVDIAGHMAELFEAERGAEKAKLSSALAPEPTQTPPSLPATVVDRAPPRAKARWPWAIAAVTAAGIAIVVTRREEPVAAPPPPAEIAMPVPMAAPIEVTAPIEVAAPIEIAAPVEAPPEPAAKKRARKPKPSPKPGVPMWGW